MQLSFSMTAAVQAKLVMKYASLILGLVLSSVNFLATLDTFLCCAELQICAEREAQTLYDRSGRLRLRPCRWWQQAS